jgi:subtilisin family serine protease
MHKVVAIVVLFFVSAGYAGADCYVVKTNDAGALEEFTAGRGLDASPLITWPDASARVLEMFGGYRVLEGEIDGLADEIARLPGVCWVEYEPVQRIDDLQSGGSYSYPDTAFDEPYWPDDPMFAEQWDKVIARLNWAWQLTKGEGVVIAILDTGVDTDHEDLVDNLVAGYDFVHDTTVAEDDYGHGTHVAGIAAARIDNAKGIAGAAGSASIMPVKVANSNGKYNNPILAQGIIFAAEQNADIINVSLGGTTSTVLADAINYAWDSGMFICAAAGNNHEDTSEFPAAYPHVMSVGATTAGDSRCSYSNYGETVAVFAPGGTSFEEVLSTTYDGNYGYNIGTSMACPQVAGLAALIIAMHPEYSAQNVWDKIVQTADPIPVSLDLRINAMAALDIIGVQEKKESHEEGQVPDVIGSALIQQGDVSFFYQGPASEYTLNIFDAAGRKVFEKRGHAQTAGSITSDISSGRGVYFWEFETRAQTTRGKLILIR